MKKSGAVIEGFPSEVQVVTFMSVQSRERQHMCLAQRGVVRKGLQKGVVRNYVSLMGTHLWTTKFPSFGALASLRLRGDCVVAAWWLRGAEWFATCVVAAWRLRCGHVPAACGACCVHGCG